MKNYFLNTRKKIVVWLFEHSQKQYVRLFKQHKKAWNINVLELAMLPKKTLGYQYYQFLTTNNFSLMPKLERHDTYHLITGYKTQEQDEIALQYLCFGNGKRSIYLFCVLILGTLILPDYMSYYKRSYKIGKNANPFYKLDFESLLKTDLQDIQEVIFTKDYLTSKLNIL